MPVYISTSSETGRTLFATIVKLSDASIWNQTAGAFQAAPSASDQKISLPEGTLSKLGSYFSSVNGLGDAGFVRIRIHDDIDVNDKTIGINDIYVFGGIEYASTNDAAIAAATRTNLATELARIDVSISTRNSTTPPTATAVATAVWTSGTRSLTTFGTLVADVAAGVWGATTRTLSGFGFTVNTNANATELAILAAVSESSGTGAYVVTVTVKEGVNLLQNATVRLSEGINSFTAKTNASGVATFSVNAATFTRTVTKSGYQFTPDTIVVTGAGNFDASMTETVIPSPTDPDMSQVYLDTVGFTGQATAGVVVIARIIDPLPIEIDSAVVSKYVLQKSTETDGRVYFDTFPGVRYKISSDTLGFYKDITGPDVGTTEDIQDLPNA